MSAYQDFIDFVDFHGCKLFVPEDQREDLPPLSVYQDIDRRIHLKVPDGYDGKHPRWKEAESVPANPLVVGRVTPAGAVEMYDADAREFRAYPLGKPVAHSEHDPFVLPAGSKLTSDWGPFPDQHTPGAKLDDGKIDMSLLEDFGDALMEICRVGSYGQVKYSRGGWLKVPNGILRYTAAMFRHFFAEKKGTYDTDPWYDTEKGLPFKGKVRHDAQVAWNAIARLQRRLNEEAGRE